MLWGRILVFVVTWASLAVGRPAVNETGGPGPVPYRVTTTVQRGDGPGPARDDVVQHMIMITHVGGEPVEETSFKDDLSDQLDGARWNGDLDVSSGTAAFDGTVLAWAGQLDVGEVVTVTYSVTVIDEGRGTDAR